MELGIDIGSYFDEKKDHAKYYIKGKKVDPIQIFRNNGLTYARMRLWVDPYDEKGHPYGGGTNDLKRTLKLSKILQKYGYKILLDFHYSDFWADPGKQMIPKAWEGLNLEQLITKVHDYTLEILKEFKKDKIVISAVQTGNEITNGTLWPYGQIIYDEKTNTRSNYDSLFKILESAGKAVREFDPSIKIVIHLESAHQKERWAEYFTYMMKHHLDFDIVGSSYYPYWHGSFEQFFDNMDNITKITGKPIWVVEYAYGFSEADYIENNNGIDENHMITNFESAYIPYPLTVEGQKEHIKTFLSLCKAHKYIEAIFYWEPLWLPRKHTYWATPEGEHYIHEDGKSTRNEWSNQCLYDYKGNALPGLDEFKI